MQRLTFAVAIPTYRREEVLCQTIREIFKQSILPDEFVIVDQSESHLLETESFLKEQSERGRLRWIRHYPPSLAAARNRALCETKSDIIVFIDDDILTHPDFLIAHLRNYTDSSVAAVLGQIRRQDGKVAETLPLGINLHNPADVIKRLPHNYSKRLIAPCIVGCNFSVRRQVIYKIMGFNEYVPGYGEDTELAFRLWEKGFRTIFDPEAWVVHLKAPTGGCRLSEKTNWEREWRRIAGYPYIAFRYCASWRNRAYFRYLFWLTLRSTILLKQNLIRPWRCFRGAAISIKAICQAYQWARLRTPLVTVKWGEDQVGPSDSYKKTRQEKMVGPKERNGSDTRYTRCCDSAFRRED